MADSTLANLSTIDALADADIVYTVRPGGPTDYKSTALQIKNYVLANRVIGTDIAKVEVEQVIKSADYTLVSGDRGKHILHPSADTTARTWTIPANTSVAYPIGTALTFVNQNAAGVITLAITTDTMRLAGAGTTGDRTIAANGMATALKITATEWIISGTGLT